jgi:hypothetical protein
MLTDEPKDLGSVGTSPSPTDDIGGGAEKSLRLRKWRAHGNVVEIEHGRDLRPLASEEARVHAAVRAYVLALEEPVSPVGEGFMPTEPNSSELIANLSAERDGLHSQLELSEAHIEQLRSNERLLTAERDGLREERDGLIGAVADHITTRGFYYAKMQENLARAEKAEARVKELEAGLRDILENYYRHSSIDLDEIMPSAAALVEFDWQVAILSGQKGR